MLKAAKLGTAVVATEVVAFCVALVIKGKDVAADVAVEFVSLVGLELIAPNTGVTPELATAPALVAPEVELGVGEASAADLTEVCPGIATP